MDATNTNERIALWAALGRLMSLLSKEHVIAIGPCTNRWQAIDLYDIPMNWQCQGLTCAPILLVYNSAPHYNENNISKKKTMISCANTAIEQLQQALPTDTTPFVNVWSDYTNGHEEILESSNDAKIQKLMMVKTIIEHEVDEIIARYIALPSDTQFRVNWDW